jgi:predicted Rossmann fold nucleotide-binding protein DprA/Smf involved in DNA uptake
MPEDLLSTVCSELDERLAELRPAPAEYEQLLAAAAALNAGEEEPAPEAPAEGDPSSPTQRAGHAPRATAPKPASTPTRRRTSRRRKRSNAPRGAAQEAILAALQHGSHTTSELVSVTALPAPTIRTNLHRLHKQRVITRTPRGGRSAYTLGQPSPGA